MSGRQYQALPSGMVVPIEPAPAKPKLGPLEFARGERRQKVAAALHVLWDATHTGRIEFEEGNLTGARRAVVRLAMDLFLGTDAEFEEKTSGLPTRQTDEDQPDQPDMLLGYPLVFTKHIEDTKGDISFGNLGNKATWGSRR